MITPQEFVAEMPRRSLEALTELLALDPDSSPARPSDDWLARQAEAVTTLPRELLRPSNPLKRLTVKLSERVDLAGLLPEPAVLCLTHRALDPWTIRRLFHLVTREVTIHVDRVRKFKGYDEMEKKEREKEKEKGKRKEKGEQRDQEGEDGILSLPEVSDFIRRMDGVSALYMTEDMFAACFVTPPPEGYARVRSGCEACMLAVVGARGRLLADLRANLLSRRHRRAPALLRVVDAWIKWFGKEGANQIRRESEALATRLKDVRRWVMKRRRVRRERRKAVGRGESSGRQQTNRATSEGCPLPKTSHRRSGNALTEADGHAPATSAGQAWAAAAEDQMADELETPLLGGDADGLEEDDDERAANDNGDDDTWKAELYEWYLRSAMNLPLDTESIHPAFRPAAASLPAGGPSEPFPIADALASTLSRGSHHPSAFPTPLTLKKNMMTAGADDARSWVTCTVHTVVPSGERSGREPLSSVPPVPRVPSAYMDRRVRASDPFADDINERDREEIAARAMPPAPSSVYSQDDADENNCFAFRDSPDDASKPGSPSSSSSDGNPFRFDADPFAAALRRRSWRGAESQLTIPQSPRGSPYPHGFSDGAAAANDDDRGILDDDICTVLPEDSISNIHVYRKPVARRVTVRKGGLFQTKPSEYLAQLAVVSHFFATART